MNDTKCTYDPKLGDPKLGQFAMGMYHCPECGDMVLAGVDHPDYIFLEESSDVVE